MLAAVVAAAALPALGAETAGVAMETSVFVRKGYGSMASTTSIQLDNGSQHREGFIRFNLAQQLDDILYRAESVQLRLTAGADAGGNPNNQFAVYQLPASMADWPANITYADAEAGGLLNYYANLVYTSPKLGADQEYLSGNILDQLRQYFMENPNAGSISYKLASLGGGGYTVYGRNGDQSQRPALLITYREVTDTERAELVRAAKGALEFSALSSEPRDRITQSLTLPARGAGGVNISWSTSNSSVVDKAGTVYRPSEGSAAVRLTAEFSYDDVKERKIFDISVLGGETVLPVTDTTFIRKSKDCLYSMGLIQLDVTPSDDRRGLLKFTLSEEQAKLILEEAESVKIRITTLSDAENTAQNRFDVRLLPAGMEDWETGLTFATAQEQGYLENDMELCYTSPVPLAGDGAYYSDNLLTLLRRRLEENPSSRILGFRLSGIGGGGFSIAAKNTAAGKKPALIISKRATDAEKDCQALTLPDTVTESLSLPARGACGSDITWSSSNPALISEQGAVTRPAYAEDSRDEDPEAVLTARVSDGKDTREKAFTLRVRRDGVLDAADCIYIQNGDYRYASLSDGDQILFGNTAGQLDNQKAGFVRFDLSEYAQRAKTSRKIQLALYLDGSAAGKTIAAYPVGDPYLKSKVNRELYYMAAGELLEKEAGAVRCKADKAGRILLDVTEYVMEQEDGVACFRLGVLEDGYCAAYNNSVPNQNPKLYFSPVALDGAYAVAKTREALTVESLTGQPADFITDHISLPAEGAFGTRISWSSSDPSVIDPLTGRVTRPPVEGQSRTVTLTASLSNDGAAGQTSFTLQVVKQFSDKETVEYELERLTLEELLLTGGLALPDKGRFADTKITWSSAQPAAQISGNRLSVARGESETAVTLTAEVACGSASDTKEFAAVILRDSRYDILRYKTVLGGNATADNSNDDDMATVWESGGDRSLTIDMGADRRFGEFIVVPSTANITGCKIESSRDKYEWQDVASGGALAKDRLNYIRLSSLGGARYLRFTFAASGAFGIRFLAGYGSLYSGGGSLEGLTLPRTVSGDFTLPEEFGGGKLQWTSKNPEVIQISGTTAKVTRMSENILVTLVATTEIGGLPYEKSFYVTVLKKSGSYAGGSGGTVIGGGKKPSTGGGTQVIYEPAPVSTPAPSASPSPAAFSDLDQAPWAEEYIEALAKRGIAEGRGDGQFEPNGLLKREEFIKLVITGFELENSGAECSFEDVSKDDWFYPYVASAAALDLSRGISETRFGAGQEITRQDAACLLYRAAGILEIPLPGGKSRPFADDGEIADYARENVYAMLGAGVVSGAEGFAFHPREPVTRAQMAKMLCTLLQLAEKQ